MYLKPKILISSTVLSFLAISITTGIILAVVYYTGKNIVQEKSQQHLVSLREQQKYNIEHYFQQLGQQVTQISLFLSTQLAPDIQNLQQAFNQISPTPEQTNDYRNKLQQYYNRKLPEQYRQHNRVPPSNIDKLLPTLSPTTLALQYHYFADLNKKNQSVSPNIITYKQVHDNIHTQLLQTANIYGYENLFLIDFSSGNIIYSVYKKSEFANSLSQGYYASSGLGEIFHQISRQPEARWTMTNFSPYLPNYQKQTNFIAIPIFHQKQAIAILAVQISTDTLNQRLTYEQKWQNYQLGETGESYLVNSNKKLLTESRFFLENKSKYVEIHQQLEPNQSRIIQSTIGEQNVNTLGVNAAFEQISHTDVFNNYQGKTVLSAYTPIQVKDQTWALLVEMELDEILQPLSHLINRILQFAFIALLITLFISSILSIYLVSTMTKPIDYLRNIMHKVTEGDFDIRAKLDTNDEISALSHDLDELLQKQITRLNEAEKENDQLNDSVIKLLNAVSKLSEKDLTVKVKVTKDMVGPVADALNLLSTETAKVLHGVRKISEEVANASDNVKAQSDSVIAVANMERQEVEKTASELSETAEAMNRIAELAQTCNSAADNAIKTTQTALETVTNTVDGINDIREIIHETEKRIKRLGERSQEISGTVNLINSIAERTHILALNASMHAASAGEAGRGFAVVADEVQRLAENARDATSQISTLVNNIQIETADTVTTMNKAITQVVGGTRLAEQAGEQMKKTKQTTANLVAAVQRIATNSQNQARISNALRDRAYQIQASTQQTSQQLQEQTIHTNNLVQYSEQLLTAVRVFKLPNMEDLH